MLAPPGGELTHTPWFVAVMDYVMERQKKSVATRLRASICKH